MRLGSDQFLSVLSRRRWSAAAAFLLICAMVIGFGIMATPRWDAYALLLVGESLAERRTVELSEKQAEDNVMSLVLIAKTDDVLTQAAEAVGWVRLFPDGGSGALDDASQALLKLRAHLGVGDASQPASPPPAAPNPAAAPSPAAEASAQPAAEADPPAEPSPPAKPEGSLAEVTGSPAEAPSPSAEAPSPPAEAPNPPAETWDPAAETPSQGAETAGPSAEASGPPVEAPDLPIKAPDLPTRAPGAPAKTPSPTGKAASPAKAAAPPATASSRPSERQEAPASAEAPASPSVTAQPASPRTVPTAKAAHTPALLSSLQRAVTVKPETKANLIRISFGHRDPEIAAQFTNALSEALITRQAELWSRPGALDFFQIQRKRFEEEVRQASAAFAAFIASSSAYSITDQRQLLLRRASDVAASLAATRGSIAERNGQKQALADQLQRLKPVAANPFVSNLVDVLGGSDRNALGPRAKAERGPATEPPLLLVKVYQDAMVQLLKVNSELAGFNLMAEAQEKELKKVDAELASLIGKEAEFERLKKAVAVAASNAEIYSKRLFEEEVNADLAKARMAGLRLVQSAFVPVKPAFPNVALLGAGALIVGFMAALATALLIEWRAATRLRPHMRAAPFGGPYGNNDMPYADTPYHASVSIRLATLEERRAPQISHD